jgi:hypothetical protein
MMPEETNVEPEELLRRVRDAPRRRITASSLNQSLGGVEVWSVDVYEHAGSWSAKEQRTETVVTFDGQGVLSDRVGVRDVGRGFRPHPSVRLLFPERLFVWGKPNDDWTPAWTEPADDGLVVVGLRHRTDRSLLASLTYDVERNLFTRFDGPSESVHLREISIVSS